MLPTMLAFAVARWTNASCRTAGCRINRGERPNRWTRALVAVYASGARLGLPSTRLNVGPSPQRQYRDTRRHNASNTPLRLQNVQPVSICQRPAVGESDELGNGRRVMPKLRVGPGFLIAYCAGGRVEHHGLTLLQFRPLFAPRLRWSGGACRTSVAHHRSARFLVRIAACRTALPAELLFSPSPTRVRLGPRLAQIGRLPDPHGELPRWEANHLRRRFVNW